LSIIDFQEKLIFSDLTLSLITLCVISIIMITQLNSNEALIGSYPKNIIKMG